MHNLALYLKFVKIRFLEMFTDRISFWVATLLMEISYGADYLMIWVLIHKFKNIGGWGSYEVMFLYALNLISYSLAGFVLFHPTSRLPRLIENGEFDEVLTKPLNPSLYLISKEFNPGYIFHITLAIAVLVLCFTNLNIALTLPRLLFLLVVMFSGALIQGAAFIFTSVPSFWLIKNNSIRSVLMYDMKEFIRYPISIYSKFLQILLTVILPYAFINFYPAQFFLDKNDFLMFHPILQYLSPVVGIILFLAAYKFWTVAIQHYQSTGS